jgi:hypothetical protein
VKQGPWQVCCRQQQGLSLRVQQGRSSLAWHHLALWPTGTQRVHYHWQSLADALAAGQALLLAMAALRLLRGLHPQSHMDWVSLAPLQPQALALNRAPLHVHALLRCARDPHQQPRLLESRQRLTYCT